MQLLLVSNLIIARQFCTNAFKFMLNHYMGKTGKPNKLRYSPCELVGIRAIRTESTSHFKAVGTNESCWRSLQ